MLRADVLDTEWQEKSYFGTFISLWYYEIVLLIILLELLSWYCVYNWFLLYTFKL